MGPVAGVSAAWMPRPSPQGRVYGVSRNRAHPAFDRFLRSVGRASRSGRCRPWSTRFFPKGQKGFITTH
ncbi:hypothetical protein DL544_06545 [Stenotrophomonas sp. pho]|nr:hypothetical protein DL544_06545 [Stenotrophomonas sp. pho]